MQSLLQLWILGELQFVFSILQLAMFQSDPAFHWPVQHGTNASSEYFRWCFPEK